MIGSLRRYGTPLECKTTFAGNDILCCATFNQSNIQGGIGRIKSMVLIQAQRWTKRFDS
jgi:hypothetical protein